jgi:hypothetical protein
MARLAIFTTGCAQGYFLYELLPAASLGSVSLSVIERTEFLSCLFKFFRIEIFRMQLCASTWVFPLKPLLHSSE